MRMNLKSLQDRQKWEEMGFKLPDYSVEKMIENTANNPEWIHFGAGNIFRAFPAVVCQHLLNSGIMTTGIIVAEGYDYEIIEKMARVFRGSGTGYQCSIQQPRPA